MEVVSDPYGEAYDVVLQEQGNDIEVYGLGQQGPTESMVSVENNIENYKIQVPMSMAQQRLEKLTRMKHKIVAMTQVMTLLLKLVMLATLTGTTMAHNSMKAPSTKRGGADAELAMDNETLHWHKVTGKHKE